MCVRETEIKRRERRTQHTYTRNVQLKNVKFNDGAHKVLGRNTVFKNRVYTFLLYFND